MIDALTFEGKALAPVELIDGLCVHKRLSMLACKAHYMTRMYHSVVLKSKDC